MTTNKPASAVLKAVNALRQLVVERKDGELLGSEEELLNYLGVSRPTLRQAAALVAQEHWLRVKRGVGGGYFASRPNTRAVAHMAASYLQAHHATVEEIIRAVYPIRIALAQLAARNRAPEPLNGLRLFLERENKRETEGLGYRDFLASEREFGTLLGNAGGNKLLALFFSISYDLASRVRNREDIYMHRPDRVQAYRKMRNRLISAILEGDEQLAALEAERTTGTVIEWLLEDLRSTEVKGDHYVQVGTANASE